MAPHGFVRDDCAGLLVKWLTTYGTAEQAESIGTRLSSFTDSGFLPKTVWCEALDEVASTLPTPAILGVGLGLMVEVRHWGVVGHLALSSNTLGAAVNVFRSYGGLHYAAATVELIDLGDMVDIRWAPDVNHLVTSIMGMLSMVMFAQRETRTYCHPSSIEFSAQGSDIDRDICERHFACPVVFGAPRDIFTFPSVQKKLPLRHRSDTVFDLLQEKIEDGLLQSKRYETAMELQVKQAIESMLIQGDLSLDRVAKSMFMSPRTLQRKLSSEDLSWHELLDTVRSQLATKYLGDAKLSIGDIAGLLGYSEVSSFSKAFRRWRGITPYDFRSQHPQAA